MGVPIFDKSANSNLPNNSVSLYLTSTNLNQFNLKTPHLYETWNWEGDLSVLPHKLMQMVKFCPNLYDCDMHKVKEYLKKTLYTNPDFDPKSFFFITHRSEVAGCVYVNKIEDSYHIQFLLVNKNKYSNKSIDEALLSMAVNRAYELSGCQSLCVCVDLNWTNLEKDLLESFGFKK